ncbi:TPA: hypothetical protein ACQFDA_004230 [Escherichia coli]
MNQFSVDAERLASFKERAQSATKNGYIEKGVRDICKLINDHPHLATMWSCEGHGIYSKSPGHLRIIFATHALGNQIPVRLMSELAKSDLANFWNLSLCRLHLPEVDSELLYPEPDYGLNTDDTSYWAWQIGYMCLINRPALVETRQALYKAFHTVLVENK